jgi:hypothetical protein
MEARSMIVVDCQQGDDAWRKARLGIPTASSFDRIITEKTRKLSAASHKYLCELCAEWLLGEPLDAASSGFIQRGSEMEQEAASWYEFDRNVELAKVGFCLRDDSQAGCSPDRFAGSEGLVEIKVPSAHVHVGYLLDGFDAAYRCQTQGQLFVTGRSWVDLVAYNPALPPLIVRIERDEEFIADLATAVEAFTERLNAAKERLLAMGCVPKTSLPPHQPDADDEEFDRLVGEMAETINTQLAMGVQEQVKP